MGIAAPIPGADTVQIERLQELWTDAELNNVATRRIDINVEYDSFDEFWQANTAIRNSVSIAVASLPANDIDALQERVRATLPPRADGQITYAARANAVKGTVG